MFGMRHRDTAWPGGMNELPVAPTCFEMNPSAEFEQANDLPATDGHIYTHFYPLSTPKIKSPPHQRLVNPVAAPDKSV